jgi:hypothetical protein
MVGSQRQGWAIFAAMACCSWRGVTTVYTGPKRRAIRHFAALHVDQAAVALQSGGNMEGKEVRFGIANSALFATITTDASCGAVNAMHDSFMPLGGMVPMVNIMLGEIIFGGVGSGLYGMLLFVIVAVFVAGLMVGRTPEYLGKKIEAKEVKMAMLGILILPLSMLGFTALGAVLPAGCGAWPTPGRTACPRSLYAYVSATGNNGSAFAGLSANTMFYNTTLGIAMFIGRFLMIIPDAGDRRLAGGQEDRAAVRRHVPDRWPLFVGLRGRRDHDRRRPDLLPGARARSHRRASRDARGQGCTNNAWNRHMNRNIKTRARRICLDMLRSQDPGPPSSIVPQARSAHHDRATRSCSSSRSSRRSPLSCSCAICVTARSASRLRLPDQSLAVVHRAVRQFRRGGGRGPRQGAGRLAAQDQAPNDGQALSGHGKPRASRRRAQARATSSWSRRATDPQRRRGHRGRGLGQRVGDHRRIRAGHPRSGGDRSAVTGGTQVISDWIKVRSPLTPARPSSTA